MTHKVWVEDLRLGMYVAALDRPWLGTPFLFQGFAIRDETELAKLRECCRYVFIDPEQSEVSVAVSHAPAPVRPVVRLTPPPLLPPVNLSEFAERLPEAREARESAGGLVDQLMEDARMGRSISTGEAKRTVHRLVDTIAAHPAAALWLTNLKRKDEYTSIHCLNVCVLAIAFAHYLGLPREQVEVIGLGALLHDVGKMRTPEAVLNKPGRLNEEELAVIRRHPGDGYELLRASGSLPRQALEIVRHHHERLDGEGYPDRLMGEGIGLHVLIGAIADVYDAITSDRVYRRASPPHEAMRMLQAMAPTTFGVELVEEFVRCLGIYPAGSLVRLDNGSLAVVISTGTGRRLKPIVMLVRDAEGMPVLPRRLIDLAAMSEQTGWGNWAIVGVVDPAEHGIDVRALVEEEGICA